MESVSIIVVGWNVRDELLRCLESIEEYSQGVDTQVIVVDNGSTDGTVSAVEERFPGAHLIRLNENLGVAARNDGLRVATGDYVMFLDSDAKLTAGALPELLSFMKQHREVGLVGPKLVYGDGSLQRSARRFPSLLLPLLRRPPLNRFFENSETVRRHLMIDDTIDHAREVEYVLGACQMFSADAKVAAGEIDDRIFFGPDDIDWCLRIRGAGYRIAYDPDAVVIHDYRRSTAERPLSRAALRHLAGFAYFQWKWRRSRHRLLEEGRQIDLRGGAL